MRLIKTFEKSKATEFLSGIIDTLIIEFGYNFFDSIEFKTGADNVNVKEGRAEITIDENNKAIKEMDERAVRIMILHKLETALFRKNISLPGFIEKIIVNRRLIKRFSSDVFYLSYLFLIRANRKIDDMDTFLEINVPWLSFHSSDEYNSRFLYKMLNMFKYEKAMQQKASKLFTAVKRDLEIESNLTKALGEFKAIE